MDMGTRARLFRGSFICLVAAVIGCASNQGCKKDKPGPPTVVLTGTDNHQIPVRVEVVSREVDRARGLMHRQHLPDDAGMLFVYPGEGNHTFWMKNTYIPLDLVFIDSKKRVVGLAENTKPLSLERIQVDLPSQYILEVNAGFVSKHKIRQGSQVVFRDIKSLW